MDVKTCPKCKTEKTVSEFWRDASTRDGLKTQCKPCATNYHNSWYKKNREYAQEYGRNRLREKTLPLERYETLLAAQDGGCAACGTKDPGGKGRFHVDHDHDCCPRGRIPCAACVRGLLCHRCNLVAVESWRVRAVLAYLEAWENRRT